MVSSFPEASISEQCSLWRNYFNFLSFMKADGCEGREVPAERYWYVLEEGEGAEEPECMACPEHHFSRPGVRGVASGYPRDTLLTSAPGAAVFDSVPPDPRNQLLLLLAGCLHFCITCSPLKST